MKSSDLLIFIIAYQKLVGLSNCKCATRRKHQEKKKKLVLEHS